jgi:hypothetical protein
MNWLDELELELRTAGVPPGPRRRILAEFADHLASDPGSEERLGSPAELARLFADEHATRSTRRSVIAGLLIVATLLACLWIIDTYVSTSNTWAAISCGRSCTPQTVEHIRQSGPWPERMLSDSLWAIPLAIAVGLGGTASALLVYRPSSTRRSAA